ncbi:alkaline phosphatase D family protein [Flagellimonas allohymeniacidonis]|uniref:Alkaline phosphatase family protein n=1 Tax=Flagellimonas allohymeniacidonis TaxID=2517819 RepID=A0A4Q8QLA6_9FLAO|nr:alkaline phosphatase D family protein [Allomuricauda hymeniacidonis]TAI49319.1 alkaline phosphatase family protein [Allomuricauda hymeniacidonis]
MERTYLYLVMSLLLVGCKTKEASVVEKAVNEESINDSVFVVAFGSCDKQDETNPFWDDVLAETPDVWIWGGDNIYADTDDMELMQSMYAKQKQDPNYKKLSKTVPIVGTWDDHDYGLNDGGEEFVMKSQSQQLFLDFLDVPANDSRRKQNGVYAAHDFKTPSGNIKVLVLDTRYFRSQLEKDENPNRRYKINRDDAATILGQEQWQWLRKELDSSQAKFNLIVTSIQFLSWEHGFESWGNFPKEVEKLKRVIVESGAEGVMVLSGDRHISEFSKTKLPSLSYPLVDFTSSGLTHSYSSYTFEPNDYRVGEVVPVPSFGLIYLDLAQKEVHFKIMGENGKIYQELKQSY